MRVRSSVRPREHLKRASARAARVPVLAAVDPLEGLSIDDLHAYIEASIDVLKDAAPTVTPDMAQPWVRPIRRELRALAEDIDAYLGKIAKSAEGRWAFLRKAGPDDIDVPDSVFGRFERGMYDVLEDLDRQVGEMGWTAATDVTGLDIDYTNRTQLLGPRQDVIGQRVTQISDASRGMLDDAIGTATQRGYSIEQTVRGVPGDSFTGLRPMVDRWQQIAPVNTTTDRATLIALTETAHAYNSGALDAYDASGLVEKVNVFDGVPCGWSYHLDPDTAHGSQRTLAEARAHTVSHPHCQRAFGAVVAGAPAPGRPGAQSNVRTPSVLPQPSASELELRARAIQAAKFDQAARADETVTGLMEGIARDTNGSLAGLDHRLKLNGQRTIDKMMEDVLVARNPLEEARKVKDALRYTLINEEADVYAGARRTVESLNAKGYTVIKWKDNWTNSLTHDINSAFRAPDGTRFEVQFHTPTSFVRKMEGVPGIHRPSHVIYEELRVLPKGDPRIPGLEAELKALWKDVPLPKGDVYVPPIIDKADAYP